VSQAKFGRVAAPFNTVLISLPHPEYRMPCSLRSKRPALSAAEEGEWECWYQGA